jgi:hypothetical protein
MAQSRHTQSEFDTSTHSKSSRLLRHNLPVLPDVKRRAIHTRGLARILCGTTQGASDPRSTARPRRSPQHLHSIAHRASRCALPLLPGSQRRATEGSLRLLRRSPAYAGLKGSPEVAAASIDQLRRYIELLFKDRQEAPVEFRRRRSTSFRSRYLSWFRGHGTFDSVNLTGGE